MEQLETILTGHGKLHVYNDQSYTGDLSTDDILRCSKRITEGCTATLSGIDGEHLIEGNSNDSGVPGHTHASTPYLIRRHKLEQEMLLQARTTLTPLFDIFQNVSLT